MIDLASSFLYCYQSSCSTSRPLARVFLLVKERATDKITNLMNSLSPAFYMEPNEDPGDRHQIFGQIHHHLDSSSSFYSYQFYFSSNSTTQDQAGYCPTQVYLPHQHHPEDNKCDEVENKVEDNDLIKLSLGGTGNRRYDDQVQKKNIIIPDNKWMSSKMRVMQKMKKSDRKRGGDHPKLAADQKHVHRPSLCTEAAEYSSNSSSSPNYSNTAVVRVCSDCNTTKTPLWRSGPKGPKSLCNACGIRQRKARRALAAAAAAAAENGTPFGATDTTTTATTTTTSSATPTRVKIKVTTHEDKTTTTKNKANNYGPQRTVPFKKRTTANAASQQQQKHKKPGSFEDFLVNLTNDLAAIHNVFPQDEKDAAILLMALSCGLVHG